jgi:hypothetical protein
MRTHHPRFALRHGVAAAIGIRDNGEHGDAYERFMVPMTAPRSLSGVARADRNPLSRATF